MIRKFNRVLVYLSVGIFLAAFLLPTMAGAQAARGSRLPRRCSSPSLHHPSARSTQKQLSCLPKDVEEEDVVDNGAGKKAKVTVGKKLNEMKARCRKGKLLDRKGREIRFFHISCWGNPPPDYLEIQRQEQAGLAKLRQRYTVIVLGCDPLSH